MKLAVFGATGGTGRELILQALDRGHEVTAIVRRPEAFTLTHARLRTEMGDVMKPDSFAPALQHQDAVLSVIGKNSLKPMTFYRQSARNIVDQMNKAGVQRLVCLTSIGVLTKPVGPLLYVWLIKPLLRNIYDDMRHMEQTILDSNLAWTIVRPSFLFDGKRLGRYRVGSSGELAHANRISRADLASCLLDQLDNQENRQKTIAVAY
ncbi:NAD(P)-dependent oxidoreductase [Spirosoma sp. KUDC1026]|uniref:NAD(P)-dependent oxidoreductase n=1 Tax=Spirosoma sp. KUDC1026 TaxID=2745947 RepID=UPI00159BA01C|nr:SDR family oxidoreductase [Spirosoma sp. KUDC1026]QKZ14319.1 SDR family oxidoreductase [Spirosoma sp. KUDC1026]